MAQIFLSHTKHDENFCDRFDRVIARVPTVNAFRSELEEFTVPAWKTIKSALEESSALFLLIGKELVNRQDQTVEESEIRENWRHTQNWISYEIGLACQLDLDVWVLCDSVDLNFPVPYLNNYHIRALNEPSDFAWLRTKIENYARGKNYPYGFQREYRCACPHPRCGSEFNLHTLLKMDDEIICPSCLRRIRVSEGKATALDRLLDSLKENRS